ncbi:MAG: hypothetical protein IPP34_20005 [Bacteroidetes bacterium]|nr:hypothetical protein [Bacteroidota bacterium]
MIAYFKLDFSQAKITNKQKAFIPEQRLLIIGNGVVGKSHLVEKIIEGEIKDEIHSTHGMNYREWKTQLPLKIKKSKSFNTLYRVLDFGGQEYFHDIHHLFFTQRTKGLLVYCSKPNPSQLSLNTEVSNTEQNEIEPPLEYWLDN